MIAVKDILSSAVRQYNNTIFGRNAEFHSRISLSERKGLFYNTLRRQFQYDRPTFKFCNKVTMDNLRVTFAEDGVIKSFYIDRNFSYGDSEEERMIFGEINACSNLEYLDTEVRISFDSIKNFTFKF